MSEENKQGENAQDQTQPAQPKQRTQPEIKVPASQLPKAPTAQMKGMSMPRNRHEMSFRHDVFMSDVQLCIRNLSFQDKVLMRENVEHKHAYHSHNNQGRKLTRTGQACDHWHNVEHFVDPVTGATKAVCGPAMRKTTKVSPTGRTFDVVEPVYFEEEVVSGEDVGQVRKVVDNHRHELNYIGSEELSPAGIASAQKEQRALAQAMGITIDPASVQDKTPAAMTPADGATIS